MRLLNTPSITICEFNNPNNIPRYAIVSHRWREEEVTLQDMKNPVTAQVLRGYAKLIAACNQATKDGFSYVWLDTCCIDKTSSAELSEAINSMYEWYSRSAICYAFMDDVSGREDPMKAGKGRGEFGRSEWFTRGWTLQELIAPTLVVFFSCNWVEIGTKTSLEGVISEITGIDKDVLELKSCGTISVAKRMSWAAGRTTTRIEDRAYSLMGLFGVNMPTIYGEGEKAFIRLQHEIMKTSNDCSIFAWHWHAPRPHVYGVDGGLLASSPDDFQDSSWVHPTSYDWFVTKFNITNPQPAYSVTNYGIRIQLPLKDLRRPRGLVERLFSPTPSHHEPTFLACFPCGGVPTAGRKRCTFAIELQQRASDPNRLERRNIGTRHIVDNDMIDPSEFVVRDALYVEGKSSLAAPRAFNTNLRILAGCSKHEIQVNITIPSGHTIELAPTYLWSSTGDNPCLTLGFGESYQFGMVLIRHNKNRTWTSIATGHNGRMWLAAMEGSGESTAGRVHDLWDRRGATQSVGTDWISRKTRNGQRLDVRIRRGTISYERKALGYTASISLSDESQHHETEVSTLPYCSES